MTAPFLAGMSPEATLPQIPAAQAVDSNYVAKFSRCDRENIFDAVRLPAVARGRRWFGCADKSRLEHLDAIASEGSRPAAVVFTAKLARDDDGSPKACGAAGGSTDQCGTSLMLLPSPAHPCVVAKDELGRCVPVDASIVPYIAIPASGPPTNAGSEFRQVDAGEFRRRTGIRMGDFAAVRLGDRVVAAIVADAGPWNKIGEGSAALLSRLQPDGKVRTVAGGVEYVVFPGSRLDPRKISPDDLTTIVSREACARYRLLVGKPDARCR